ncbi:DUF3460 family protein [Derxia lacustris]|uniref:DUF3460 family protein n=1 Tax=Derxia lacustris TaxID=764842 RepID=UPI000A16D8D5|nr:DUF3460 family protein [Derxia lacustris]
METYTSDITQFLKQLKQAKPYLDQAQRDGRALLWEKNLDPQEQEAFRQARVAQKPYVYGSEP